MNGVDITQLSRPYNVTIDTKFCVGCSDSGEFIVFKVLYDGGSNPKLTYFKTFYEGKETSSYLDNLWSDLILGCNDLNYFSTFYFMTEKEYFIHVL